MNLLALPLTKAMGTLVFLVGKGFGHFFLKPGQEILGLETDRIKDSQAWSPGRMDNTCFCCLGPTVCDLSQTSFLSGHTLTPKPPRTPLCWLKKTALLPGQG